jgi:hypothetical protein
VYETLLEVQDVPPQVLGVSTMEGARNVTGIVVCALALSVTVIVEVPAAP